MQRYDISGGFGMDQSFHPCDDGAYVFYSDAMEEIEDWKRAWRIQSDTVKLAEAEIEKKDSLILEQGKEIIALTLMLQGYQKDIAVG